MFSTTVTGDARRQTHTVTIGAELLDLQEGEIVQVIQISLAFVPLLPFVVQPTKLVLHSVVGEAVQAFVFVRPESFGRLVVEAADCTIAGIQITEIARRTVGDNWVYVIALDGAVASAGVNEGVLSISTNSEVYPEVQVPIRIQATLPWYTMPAGSVHRIGKATDVQVSEMAVLSRVEGEPNSPVRVRVDAVYEGINANIETNVNGSGPCVVVRIDPALLSTPSGSAELSLLNKDGLKVGSSRVVWIAETP